MKTFLARRKIKQSNQFHLCRNQFLETTYKLQQSRRFLSHSQQVCNPTWGSPRSFAESMNYGAAVVKSSSDDFNPSALLHLAPSSHFTVSLFGVLLSRVLVALKMQNGCQKAQFCHVANVHTLQC